MVDYLIDRETELLNYMRINMTDPSARGTSKTDTFTATAGQTIFTLTQTGVVNISSVKVAGTTQYIGYNYKINFGEGTGATTVVLNVGATVGQTIIIIYKYGTAMIYYGFQRLDSELPRISIKPESIDPQYVAIGEDSDGTGKWQYYVCTYRGILRSRYAKQIKTMYDEFNKLINNYRQATPQPFKTVEIVVGRIIPQDYDNDLRFYQAEVMFTVKWLVKYKD